MKLGKRPPQSPRDWFKLLQALVLILTAISLTIGLVDFEVIAVWFASYFNSN